MSDPDDFNDDPLSGHLPEDDRRDSGRIGFVADFVRKVAVAGVGAVFLGEEGLRSLAGQLTELTPLPARGEGEFDEPCVLHAALQTAVNALFSNTGPTGQRAMQKMGEIMGRTASEGMAPDVVDRSVAHGRAVAEG